MANEYIFNNLNRETDIRMKGASPGKVEKHLKKLLIIAAIVLGAEIIWLFGVSPCIPLSTIEVKGFPGFDGASVLVYAGINDKASFISVNVKEAESIIGSHHLVESVRVVKRFPDRLSIYIQPRKAVALSMAIIDGRQIPVYFDRHGVIFKIGDSADQAFPANIPIISGLVFAEAKLGMQLPSALSPLLNDIAGISERAPELLEAISELRVIRKPYDGYDVMLYPAYNPVRVLLGSSINEDALRYVLVMLDVFKAQSIQPIEIDFRSVMSPYSVKEVPSG